MIPSVTIAAIICTHSPPTERLAQVVEAIAATSGFDEIIIVQNAGTALDPDLFQRMPTVRLVKERKLGLIHARCAGIRASDSAWLTFIDDDNVIDPDYVTAARTFIAAHTNVGVFGGRIVPRFERLPGRWKRAALPFLGLRDLGDTPRIVGPGNDPDFDVPGAGFLVRRDIADGFADEIESGRFGGLGRKGEDLASGDDTALCRYARSLGARLGYTPTLHLEHLITEERIRFGYLVALIERIGRSAALLDGIFATQRKPPRCAGFILRHAYHLARHGPIGWATAGWHRGYRTQHNHRNRD